MQRALRRVHLYERLRESSVYDAVWNIARPDKLASRRAEIEMLGALLPASPNQRLIFDIGANMGHKASVYLRLGAAVVCVEPDEANQVILRDKFHAWRMAKKPVSVVGKAVSSEVGETEFWINAPGSAMNTLNKKWVETLQVDDSRFGKTLKFESSRTVKTTTLDALIKEFGRPHYVKIDVEGHELEALRGLTQPVPLLSFELNLPDFQREGLECVDYLAQLSFDHRFNLVTGGREAMEFENWLEAEEIQNVIQATSSSSIEIFWRSA